MNSRSCSRGMRVNVVTIVRPMLSDDSREINVDKEVVRHHFLRCYRYCWIQRLSTDP